MKHINNYITYKTDKTNKTDKYITEAAFDNNEWYKHSRLYSNAVLDILSGDNGSKSLKLGVRGAESVINVDDITDADKRAFRTLKSTNETPVDKFNAIANKYGFKWNMIWKGPFSGYDSDISKNRGNAFEQEFVTSFDAEYRAGLEECIDKTIELSGDKPIEGVGEANTRRPLTLDGNYVYALPKKNVNRIDKFNIGDSVADIVLHTNDGPLYLSLKYGRKVTFFNCGVNNNRCFSTSAFIDKTPFGDIGMRLLDIFGIDEDKFRSAFNGYAQTRKRGQNEKVDVTEQLNNFNNDFLELVKSVIGYGYILVHKHNDGTISYYDLRTEEDMDEFIGDTVLSANIEYPIAGSKKRVDINIELKNVSLIFNIRSKNGGIYPTHIMSDYTIKN